MFKNLLRKVIPDRNKRQIGKLESVVAEVGALEAEYERLTDDDMAELTDTWRQEIRDAVQDLGERATELEEQLHSGANDPQRLRNELEDVRKRTRAAEEAVMASILPAPTPWCARPASGPSVSAFSTSRSWAASSFIRAGLRR